jgi:hypothetical protein
VTIRFYMRFTTAAPVSPIFDPAWTNTATALRRYLAPNRLAGDTIAQGDARTWNAGEVRLDRQYVGDPMAAGIVLTGALVRGLSRLSESNADDNAFIRLGLRVCSMDGTIIRATLLAVADYSNGGAELPTGTQVTYRLAHEAVAVCAAYVTQHGDRLVFETGFTDVAGTTPSASMQYGSSNADDHSTVGSSSGFNPWLDISLVADSGLASLSFLPSTDGSVQPYTVRPRTVVPGCSC